MFHYLVLWRMWLKHGQKTSLASLSCWRRVGRCRCWKYHTSIKVETWWCEESSFIKTQQEQLLSTKENTSSPCYSWLLNISYSLIAFIQSGFIHVLSIYQRVSIISLTLEYSTCVEISSMYPRLWSQMFWFQLWSKALWLLLHLTGFWGKWTNEKGTRLIFVISLLETNKTWHICIFKLSSTVTGSHGAFWPLCSTLCLSAPPSAPP